MKSAESIHEVKRCGASDVFTVNFKCSFNTLDYTIRLLNRKLSSCKKKRVSETTQKITKSVLYHTVETAYYQHKLSSEICNTLLL